VCFGYCRDSNGSAWILLSNDKISSERRDGEEMAIEIFPVELLAPERKDDVVLFLAALPIPPRRKKQAYIEWAKYVGVAIDRETVDRIIGVA